MRGFAIDQAVACVDGVFEVQFDIFFAADRNSDAALRSPFGEAQYWSRVNQ